MFEDFFSSIFNASESFFERTQRESRDIETLEKRTQKAYMEASGINIEEQKDIWNERAKGYWGEYKVFSLLFNELNFPNKIMVNVEIPSDNGRTTEIDLLLFEIKHYSGKVYGGFDKPTWTEYYKTRDSVTFDNPLKQNEYHLSQLKRLLPDAQFYSYVVFTNSNAEIKVGGRYPGYLTVSRLEDLVDKVREDFAGREEIYSADQIEKYFRVLRPYSPMENNTQEFFKKDSEILPFSGFAEAMLRDLNHAKQAAKEAALSEVREKTQALDYERSELKKQKEECIRKVSAAENERDSAVKDLKEFARNFEVVTPFTSGYGVINRDCLKVEVKFEESDSFLHTVNMIYTLSNTSTELWIQTLNAWLIVGLKNGKAQKYILREHIKNYHIGPKIEPKQKKYESPDMIRLFNVSMEDIAFIKLCNTTVTDRSNGGFDVAPGVEFEIYTAPGVDSVYDYEEAKVISNTNNGALELNPDFMKSEVFIEESADGTGSDIKFGFSACTDEVGFDLGRAGFVVGLKNGSIDEYGFKHCVRGFYSSTVMPHSKTGMYVMHLNGVKPEDIVVIKLKGARIFRKEFWNVESLFEGVEFDVYPESSDSDTQ